MVVDLKKCPARQDLDGRYEECPITIRGGTGGKEGKCGACGKGSICWLQPKCYSNWYVCPDCYPSCCPVILPRKPEIEGAKVGAIIWR